MRYLEIKIGSWPSPKTDPWWIKALVWIFPSANPDIEQHIQRTHFWWLEIDEDGNPLREIGFQEDGEAIVLAPVGGNWGFLIDASDDWTDSDKDSVEAAENFERVWNDLWPKFEDADLRYREKWKQQ